MSLSSQAFVVPTIPLNRPRATHRSVSVNSSENMFVDEEPAYLKWLVENVQSVCDLPCCIDSPSPKAIETDPYDPDGYYCRSLIVR